LDAQVKLLVMLIRKQSLVGIYVMMGVLADVSLMDPPCYTGAGR
jgi:hypothetical protein